MPIYEYQCGNCGTVIEKFSKVSDALKKYVVCNCGKRAFRILSRGSIKCDSINDVNWLPSACQVLQPDGERPLQTRGEYDRYLKDHNLVCRG